MNKKKILLVGVVAAFAVITLVVVILLLNVNQSKIDEGRYAIVGNTQYPNAYIEVKDKTVRFYNIDLNQYYQQETFESYRRLEDAKIEYTPLSDIELYALCDFNSRFVERGYDISDVEVTKRGTGIYMYRCMYYDNYIGFGLKYNTYDKTIEVTRNDVILSFKMQK